MKSKNNTVNVKMAFGATHSFLDEENKTFF